MKVVLAVVVATVASSAPAFAQVDLSGAWRPILHEDLGHRLDEAGGAPGMCCAGGPWIGDYTGLPINAAARLKADSWDARLESAPERQTILQPGAYLSSAVRSHPRWQRDDLSGVPAHPEGADGGTRTVMRSTHAALLVVILGALATAPLAAQAPAAKNPFEGDAERIRAGMAGFRIRCADCHGTDAKGVRAPDITQVWASGRTDEGLFNTIRTGVPNTEMPSFPLPRTQDYEVWQILAYLRTLAAPAPNDPPRGDAANGEKIFRANCIGCHRVNGTGGRLGPDLSRVGSARARDAIVQRIRRSFEGDFRPGFAPVTIQPQSGPPIQGVKKNEDLFSVQIMDTRERIQGYEKDKMKSVQDNTRSAMPAFGPDRLSERDLDDLLRYLQTLRGFDPAVQ